MNEEKLFEKIDAISLGRYRLSMHDAFAIVNRGGAGSFSIVLDAYRYGFLKGQRAEKAAAKRKLQAKKMSGALEDREG